MARPTGLRSFWNGPVKGVLNSYAQLFFALHPFLGFLALGVSFMDPLLGFCGLLSVVLVQLMGRLTGQNRELLQEGMYGFNALLLGLAMAHRYRVDPPMLLVLLAGLVLLLTLIVWWNRHLGRYGLPYLTLPFVLTYWVLMEGSDSLAAVTLRYPGTTGTSGQAELLASAGLEIAAADPFWKSFLRTLGSIYFQDSVLAGLLLAMGLLIQSRLSFLLAVGGYALAFGLFQSMGASTVPLTDFLVGSNFVFMAIALGGFYLVPSLGTLGLVALLTPVLAVLMFAFEGWLAPWDLPPFTLAFSGLTLLVLYFLQSSPPIRGLVPVALQYYSPEKTLYKHAVNAQRLANLYTPRFHLPFWGTWTVTQGYQGQHTHLGDWSKALDFEITDQEGRYASGDGQRLEDYYCYNKPVVAPLEGTVVALTNHVPDNPIGAVDLEQNWGNSLVLQHTNGLYTQYSHLRQDSFKVALGQWVVRGQVMATCGNSGRSPRPHLHFQVQHSPEIGARTLAHPMAYYRLEEGADSVLQRWSVPSEGQRVSSVDAAPDLVSAFAWKPGQVLRMQSEEGPDWMVDWKVGTDAYNRTYLYCSATRSTMWYVNDGVMFWAYDFEGSRSSLLYRFYGSVYRLSLVQDAGMVDDVMPLIHFSRPLLRIVQDLVAPLFLFYSVHYRSEVLKKGSGPTADEGALHSSVSSKVLGRPVRQIDFELYTRDGSLHRWVQQPPKGSNQPPTAYRCSWS
ncbi:MAG: urea transporter [Bacteroidia bacterium]